MFPNLLDNISFISEIGVADFVLSTPALVHLLVVSTLKTSMPVAALHFNNGIADGQIEIDSAVSNHFLPFVGNAVLIEKRG